MDQGWIGYQRLLREGKRRGLRWRWRLDNSCSLERVCVAHINLSSRSEKCVKIRKHFLNVSGTIPAAGLDVGFRAIVYVIKCNHTSSKSLSHSITL